jgi:predicted Zn-dependent protease
VSSHSRPDVQVGRPVEAIPHIQAAISLAPDRASFCFNLGNALGQAGQPREAIGVAAA